MRLNSVGHTVALPLLLSVVMTESVVAEETSGKRPFAINSETLEAGVFASRSSGLPSDQTILAFPLTWTKYATDSWDYRFEGSANLVTSPGSDGLALTAGPGLTYWHDSSLSFTTFLRFGYESTPSTNTDLWMFGGDIGFEKTFTLNAGPEVPFYLEDYFVAGVRLGSISRRGSTGTVPVDVATNVSSVLITGAYDTASFLNYWSSTTRLRSKFTVGYEWLAGDGTTLDQLISLTYSLRSIEASTGRLGYKGEIAFATDAQGFNRLTLGVSSSF